MGGGSLEVAEVLDDHVGDRWVSLPLGALPVEALLQKGAGEAKAEIDWLLKASLPPALTQPVFFPVGGGWRALAHAAHDHDGCPDPRRARLYARCRGGPRDLPRASGACRRDKLLALPGVPSRRARTLPAAALVLDRVLKRLAPETVVFSALGLREGWLFSQLKASERYLDPLIEGAQAIGLPMARVAHFAPALVRWTAELFAGETAADTRLSVAACALSDMAWRDHPDVRAEECFRRLLHFPFIGISHPERVFLASVIHARYGGKLDDGYVADTAGLLPRSARRRAQILGRAMTLAYRLSAGMPQVLDASRLRIDSNCVRLDVGDAARVPDSEAVTDRLRLLAGAVGVADFKIATLA